MVEEEEREGYMQLFAGSMSDSIHDGIPMD